jgi:putative transposase
VARKLRENVPGIHHVWARGVERRNVFVCDDDRRDYLAILGRVVEKFAWRCLAYCLMDNHVHLLVEIETPNLGRGMQRLHGSYGGTFNERHGRTGHLFEGRYGSKPMTSDEQLWWAIAYIANNPVDAGMCTDASTWRWGSHAAIAAGEVPPWLDVERVMEIVARAGGDPRRRYAELIGA